MYGSAMDETETGEFAERAKSLLRQAELTNLIPYHAVRRLAAVVLASDIVYATNNLGRGGDPITGRAVLVTASTLVVMDLTDATMSRRPDPSSETASVTVRRLTDIGSVTVAGTDSNWHQEQYGEIKIEAGARSITLKFGDGEDVFLPLDRVPDNQRDILALLPDILRAANLAPPPHPPVTETSAD